MPYLEALPRNQYWHLVVATKTRTFAKRSECIILECCLVLQMCHESNSPWGTRRYLPVFITDVWREYLHYEGLDVTLQLVIPSGDVNPTTASSLVDNNTTSCINTDPCLNSGNVYIDSFCLIFLSRIARNIFKFKSYYSDFNCNSLVKFSGGFRWGRIRCAPPLRSKIFSISCSFSENLTKSYVGTPPRGLAPPPTGNPGSAPEIYSIL